MVVICAKTRAYPKLAMVKPLSTSDEKNNDIDESVVRNGRQKGQRQGLSIDRISSS